MITTTGVSTYKIERTLFFNFDHEKLSVKKTDKDHSSIIGYAILIL